MKKDCEDKAQSIIIVFLPPHVGELVPCWLEGFFIGGKMGTPQLENGYTRVATEIIEQLAKTQLSGYEWRVLLSVWLKTYTWQKKEDWISYSQFEAITQLPKQNINRTIKSLVKKNILIKNGTIYSFQKDTTLWNMSKSPTTAVVKTDYSGSQIRLPELSKLTTVSSQIRLPELSKLTNTIDTITKDNKDTITKDSRLALDSVFFESLWTQYPNKDGKKAAYRYFKSSVKTERDKKDIKMALANYLNSEKVKKGFIKNGSTWFNNWRDWIEPTNGSINRKTNNDIFLALKNNLQETEKKQ